MIAKLGNTLLRIDVLLATIIVIWLNNGFLAIVFNWLPTIANYAIITIWLIFIKLRTRDLALLIYSFGLASITLMFLIISYSLNPSSNIFNFIINILYGFVISLLFFNYYRDKNAMIVLLFFVFFDYLIISLITLYHINQNDLIIRVLSSTVDNQVIILGRRIHGVANYSTVLVFSFLSTLMLILYRNSLRLTYRFVFFAAYFLMLFIIWKSQLTIIIIAAVLINLLVSVNFFLLKEKFKYLPYIISFTILTIIFLSLQNIMRVIVNSGILSDLMIIRANDIILILNGFAHQSSSTVRINQYLSTLQYFIENPIIGSFGLDNVVLGGHTSWIDIFAAVGMFALPYLISLFLLISYQSKFENKKGIKFSLYIFVFIIAIGLINPVLFPNVLLIILLIIPFSLRLLSMRGVMK